MDLGEIVWAGRIWLRGQGPVVGCCGNGNEHSGSVKGELWSMDLVSLCSL
jgi:hypothetical protein